MTDIAKAFHASAEPLGEMMQRKGVGFLIPVYQRPYSWDRDNIEQLMEDLYRGVDNSLDNADAIQFLGTLLLLTEKDPRNNIHPHDHRALPERIYNVIDGQQRLSTLALLACLLYQRLEAGLEAVTDSNLRAELEEPVSRYKTALLDMFSVDLGRGTPERKPIIIRAVQDKWTFDGSDSNYNSEVARYLAETVRAITENASYPSVPRGLVGKNLRAMIEALKSAQNAHMDGGNSDYPPAWKIIENMKPAQLWSYERPNLDEFIRNRSDPPTAAELAVCELTQLMALCSFLLEGCCFTIIEPTREAWAFDMFQSLNATGTPLTSLETFRALVVGHHSLQETKFGDSESSHYLATVDAFISQKRSASAKQRQTNELLTTFAAARDGTKLSKQFSSQRKWLHDKYLGLDEQGRSEMLKQMAELAQFSNEALKFDGSFSAFPLTEKEDDAEIAAVCVMYLKDAGHKMANTILSRFHAQMLRGEPDAPAEFVATCKALAAFFTLWRSALSNSGLDEFYRRLLREGFSWEGKPTALAAESLKNALWTKLKDRRIGTKSEWKGRATKYLRYDNAKAVCRFALFIAAHDTMVDPTCNSLPTPAKKGFSSYLRPALWKASDLKSVEHVAPQNPPVNSSWDPALYVSGDVQQIGNLVLLSSDLNSSAANKSWPAKWVYYRYLCEASPEKVEELEKQAAAYGVTLPKDAARRLRDSQFQSHLATVVGVNINEVWSKAVVDARTERICDILWDRLTEWL